MAQIWEKYKQPKRVGVAKHMADTLKRDEKIVKVLIDNAELFGAKLQAEIHRSNFIDDEDYDDNYGTEYTLYRYETFFGTLSDEYDNLSTLSSDVWDEMAWRYVEAIQNVLKKHGYTWQEKWAMDSGYDWKEWQVRFLPHHVRNDGRFHRKVFVMPTPFDENETLLEQLRRWHRGEMAEWEEMRILDDLPDGVAWPKGRRK